jgi:Uma2 family endonuclease
MTYEDYVALPDDGNRYEVIEGELCVVPAPNRKHQEVLFNLAFELRKFIHHKQLGNVYISPFDVVLSRTNVVQPDILFISNDRLAILTDAGATGAPDLAIEVSSASTRRRDEVTRRSARNTYGTAAPCRILVGRGFGTAQPCRTRGRRTLTTPLLPGLAIPLTAIFED